MLSGALGILGNQADALIRGFAVALAGRSGRPRESQ
jgi:hypothetical protein